VLGGTGGRGGVRLDLDAHDALARQLQDQVDLVAALGVTQVVQPRAARRPHQVGPHLGGDERVDDPAEQVAVRQHTVHVHAHRRCHQGGVDHVELVGAGDPLQAVGRPRRHRLGDHQVREQLAVGHGRPPVEAGGLGEALVLDDACGADGVRLEVTAEAVRVTHAADEGGVAREQLLDVAVEPQQADVR
jgi:hypothetical protein